ncbi:MAG: prenyltransferase [Aigarchaeota archaeon]|nr:prenyltransferase [Aigarchaeota archaeon]MDW8092388.1 prenyltransferase [Nitrososphaerota archaeon]
MGSIEIDPKELSRFTEVSGSYVDKEGNPVSVPIEVEVKAPNEFRVKLPRGVDPREVVGRKFTIIFNHITPLPIGGYTERRYLAYRCEIRSEGGELIATPYRRYGWDEGKIPFFQYCELTVNNAKKYLKRRGLELGSTFRPKLGAINTFIRITRLPFLLASVISVLAGASVAFYQGYFDALIFALTMIGIASAHIALNMINDYFDTKLGADVMNVAPTPFSGGSRSLIYGLVTTGRLTLLIAVFSGITLGIGAYLAVLRGVFQISSLVALGFFLIYFYTAPPIKLAYRGLGELAVALGFGPVIVIGSYFVQTQQFALEPVLVSIPVGLLIMLILYVNEIPDSPYDAAAHKRTLVVRLRRETVMSMYRLMLATTYGLIVAYALTGIAPLTVLLALLTVPYAARVYRGVKVTYNQTYNMIPYLGGNINLTIGTGAILAFGYLIARPLEILLGVPLTL